ncbi:Cyclin M transmembrane N-terminal domain-containing protein [Elsinoe fawcettii]|nr:Cyclin M transmembrane N-terminal domain-containing protein [Elsinoe fawcettii]
MSSQHASFAPGRLGGPTNSRSSVSPASFSIVKLLAASILHPTLTYAAPILSRSVRSFEEEGPKDPEDASLWVYLGTAIALVLLGGAFAGLTIALMGQDEIYLQVIATSGEGHEKKHAKKVLNLLKRGKHWVLVTLLLSNVITNETLPIVLDRSLGGGWPAVVSSTVLIVIFGEIAPQSVCVRYGLSIGAWASPFVLALMWIMSPVAWPTAKLLDWLLGEDHGTTYKKAGLKTLVTLHKSLGPSPTDRLNEDEVTIISAVLDLKEKPVGDIMTPMEDVFTMSADTVLDEPMMDTILSQGYSRIPIYAPENPSNFIGMLLVKILITYDPEDCLRVRDFALATLPETAPDTSCLDIVNFFQEGKSHMVLVSEFPGQDSGAQGVVTLEDVIEELIGEEIIDESDVFIDVHRAIRRIAPAPRTRYTKHHHHANDAKEGNVQESEVEVSDVEGGGKKKDVPASRKSSVNEPRETTFLLRRKSSGTDGGQGRPVAVRSNTVDMRQHLRHLGPSNVASRPKATKYTSVKIKPGVGTIPEGAPHAERGSSPIAARQRPASINGAPDGGQGVGLVRSAGADARDGVLALAQGYGAMGINPPIRVEDETALNQQIEADGGFGGGSPRTAAEATEFARQKAMSPPSQLKEQHDDDMSKSKTLEVPHKQASRPSSSHSRRTSASSTSTLGELEGSRRPSKVRRAARSGSITENVVNVGGMKKMVLETQSSSDNEGSGSGNGSGSGKAEQTNGHGKDHEHKEAEPDKKKKKKRGGKKHKKNGNKGGSEETSPLLGR